MTTHDSEKIRVLVADDSFFIRTYLSEILRSDPAIDVVGTASDGNEAIALAQALRPDVITMDYHMPGKNGLEAIAAIMLGPRPLPAIIMVSAFSGPDGEEVRRTLLRSGAHVVSKPSGEVSLDIEKVSEEIVKKVRQVGETELRIRKNFHVFQGGTSSRSPREYHGPLSGVVVIGASTGGPPLIEHLLSSLAPDDGLGIVIIQHMSKYFTELFAERLDRVTPFTVREAVSGSVILPGEALVVPGGYVLASHHSAEDKEKGLPACNLLVALPPPASHKEEEIDLAMETLASCYKERVVGVLLSGMGSDGSRGLAMIRANGGYTIAQNPSTATVPSMPAHAIASGVADSVAHIDEIASIIEARFSLHRGSSSRAGEHDTMRS